MNNINIGATPQKKKITIATGPAASRPRSSVVDNKIQPATKVRNTQKSASINNDVSILDMARPAGRKHGINQSTGGKVNVPKMKQPLLRGNYKPMKKMEKMRTKLPAFPTSKAASSAVKRLPLSGL